MHQLKPNEARICGKRVSAHQNKNKSFSVVIGGKSDAEREGVIRAIVDKINERLPDNPVHSEPKFRLTYALKQTPKFMKMETPLTLDIINAAIGEVASITQIGYDSGLRPEKRMPMNTGTSSSRKTRLPDHNNLTPADRKKLGRLAKGSVGSGDDHDPYMW